VWGESSENNGRNDGYIRFSTNSISDLGLAWSGPREVGRTIIIAVGHGGVEKGHTTFQRASL